MSRTASYLSTPVEVVIMEPVKGGVLAQIPEDSEKKLRSIEPEMSPAVWALRFANSMEDVIAVLSGMSTLEQIQDNVKNMKDFVPLSEMYKMKKSSIRTIMAAASGTSCGRCDKGCPAQIQVSEALVIYEKYVDGDTKTVEKLNGMISEGKPIDCIECGACSVHCPKQYLVLVKCKHQKNGSNM